MPQPCRMRSAADFRATVRNGVRVGRATLVLHARASSEADAPVRVGFVVSKAVGNAVTRNRVKRRLRHLVRDELVATPPGSRFVVRALPPAAVAGGQLGDDLHGAWSKALRRLDPERAESSRVTTR
nr:ribonuclease P protein component [Microlunatus panaciterrae]